jgi:hypothetical protein
MSRALQGGAVPLPSPADSTLADLQGEHYHIAPNALYVGLATLPEKHTWTYTRVTTRNSLLTLSEDT